MWHLYTAKWADNGCSIDRAKMFKIIRNITKKGFSCDKPRRPGKRIRRAYFPPIHNL